MTDLTITGNVIQSSTTPDNGRRFLPEWMSVEEASKRTGYVVEYLRRLIRDGKIDAEKKGTMWWVDPESLDRYVESAQSMPDARYTPRRRPS